MTKHKKSVLQKVREERKRRRQKETLIAKSIVVIQSWVRSFLVRTRLKNVLRAAFDNDEKSEYSFDKMIKQIKRLNLFFDPRIDADRLVIIARLILSKSDDSIMPKLHFDIDMQVRIRKIIVFCVRRFNVKERPREAVLMRLVNLLTDVSSDSASGIQWGVSCWLHMIERADFFHEWRKFMERKLVLSDNQNVGPPKEIVTFCTSILKKPFAALFRIRNFAGVSSFGGEYLDVNTVYNRVLHKFTASFCTNVIPSSRNSKMVALVAFPAIASIFPWMRWIKYIKTMRRKYKFSFNYLRNILYSVLHFLGESSEIPKNPDFEMSTFFDCLKCLITSIDNRNAPIEKMPLYYNNIDLEMDDDYTGTSEADTYYEDTTIVYQTLLTCFNCLEIPNWMEPFSSHRWKKLYPVLSCIIRLKPQLSFAKFRCLSQLAYNRKFIRSLYWEMISGEPKTHEEISTFCWFVCHLTETLHDAEFIGGIPLSKPEILKLINYIKNLYTTYVNEDNDSQDPIVMQTNNAVVAMLRAFHDRNTRIQMVPEEEFHSSFSLILPIDSHYIFIDENVYIPETRLLETKLLRVLRECPFSLSFHDRVRVWNRMIWIDRGDRFQGLGFAREYVQIRRKFIYKDAFDKLYPDNVKNLNGLVRISLVNTLGALEAGVDGGGLLREFLIEAIRAAIDPNLGLFRVDSQNRIFPNPLAKKLIPDYTNHFKFVGKLIGKAVYEKIILGIPFSPVFLLFLLSEQKITQPEHILGLLDPILYKSLMLLKQYEGDWNDMCIDFTISLDELGEQRVVELKENGKDIEVDATNIMEYIHLVADYKINKEMEEECRSFREGFRSVIAFRSFFSWREMQTLISGSENRIDLADWAANVNYAGGFSPEHPTIILFWQVLGSLEEKDLRKLLKFVTSCSRPPLLGFKDLNPRFGIQNAGVTDRLPTASTCINLLKLPELNTADDLLRKLLYCIHAEAGFDLS